MKRFICQVLCAMLLVFLATEGQTQTVSTIAGGWVGDGNPALQASLSDPRDAFRDAAGNLYIADTQNNRVRKVDVATGLITTVAGGGTAGWPDLGDGGAATDASLSQPGSIFVDAANNLYIADSGYGRVRKVDATTGIITTVAGGGPWGNTGDGILATDAQLNSPAGIFLSAAGDLYISEANTHRVRKVDGATQLISTVAGDGTFGFSGDGGPAISAQLYRPKGVALDTAGNLYIADAQNNRVRKVDTAGNMSTFAGGGTVAWPTFGDGGPATDATFNQPYDVFVFGSDLYVAEWGGNRIRKIDAAGIITTVAGGGNSGFNEGGLAVDAYLGNPQGIFVDANGMIFPNSQKALVRQVDGAGIITTMAGGDIGDGNLATQSALKLQNRPQNISVDAAGNVYIPDSEHNRVRKVDALTGVITTIAGNGETAPPNDGGAATGAGIFQPTTAVFDAAGNLYIGEVNGFRVRRVDPAGTITTIAGGNGWGDAGDGGPATAAQIGNVNSVYVSGNDLYIATSKSRVRHVDLTTNVITTVVGTGIQGFSGDGGAATAAQLSYPGGLFKDSAGNLFVSDTNNNRVRKVDALTGIITTVAGGGSVSWPTYGDGDFAVNAQLNRPGNLFIDAADNLFVADANTGRIRKVDAVTGVISTFAGSTSGFEGDGGLPADAKFSWPSGLFVDDAGNMYIADSNNNRIRKITAAPNVLALSATPATVTAGGSGAILRAELHDRSGALQSGDNSTQVSFEVTIGDATVRNQMVVATAGAAETVLTMPTIGTAIVQVSASGSETAFVTVDAQASTLRLGLSSDRQFITEDGTDSAVIEAQIQDLSGALQTGDNTTVVTFNLVDNQLSNGQAILSATSVTATGGIATTTLTGTLAGIVVVETSTPGAASQTVSVTVRPATDPGGGGTGVGQADPGDVITIAGGWLGDGGPAADAGFDYPNNTFLDGATLYIADRNNNRVRAINLTTGIISTVAGGGSAGWPDFGDGGAATSASLNQPQDVFVRGIYLYIADAGNQRIRKVDLTTGVITTAAGGGNWGDPNYLNYPVSVYVDAGDNLFIAESSGHVVRRVDGVTGAITTVAGTGTMGDNGDNIPATTAQLNYPTGVFGDAAGNIYIADSNNQRVRMVDASGTITTIAGGGSAGWPDFGDGWPATTAQLRPADVFVAGSTLYIADTWNSRIRAVDLNTNIIATVAGGGPWNVLGDGGPATSAGLGTPQGVWADGTGMLYIADTNNQRVRHVDAGGIITTIAGGLLKDGRPATEVTLRLGWMNHPFVDGSGSVYIADTENNRVRRVDGQGIIQTVAGGGSAGWPDYGDGGQATGAALSYPTGVFVDQMGNLYIAESSGPRVRMVDPFGIITTVAGGAGWGYSGDGGPAINAQFSNPSAVFKAANGNLYIADTGNNRIRMVDAAGIVTTVAGNGIAGFSGDGGPATAAQLNQPSGIAVDDGGNLYIADVSNNRIRMVDATGIVTTVVGGGSAGWPDFGDGGLATAAQLNYPSGVVLDWANNIYIADRSNARVRKVSASTGIITTVAGSGAWGYGGDGGPATDALFNGPAGLSADLSGNLYIADAGNKRIRQVNLAPPGVETPTGTNVVTAPVDPETGVAPADITFANVDVPGETSLASTDTGPPAPEGFQVGDEPVFFDLTTTAQFSGSVEICYNYSNDGIVNDAGMALFHYENGAWVDVTTSLDTVNDIICGSVTSFSPFALFQSEDAGPMLSAITAVSKVELDRIATLTTDIQSNGTVNIKKGDKKAVGVIDGSVLAAGNIEIADRNHITGDVTSGGQVVLQNDPDDVHIDGVVTEQADVAPVELPPVMLDMNLSHAPKIEVKKKKSLDLQPNDEATPVYGELEVEKDAEIILHSGTYIFEEISVKEEARMVVRVVDGSPVTINLVKGLDFDKEAHVEISGGDASHLLFRVAQSSASAEDDDDDGDDDGDGDGDDDDDDDDDGDDEGEKIEIGKQAQFAGTIYAPGSKIEVDKEGVVTGALIGREVKLKEGVQFTGALAAHLDLSAPPVAAKTVLVDHSDADGGGLVFGMGPNYPNPFNPATTLRYTLSEVIDVRLIVYNVLGQEVRVLVNKVQNPGRYTVVWDGRNALGRQVASGFYLARLQAGKNVAVNKMLLMK